MALRPTRNERRKNEARRFLTAEDNGVPEHLVSIPPAVVKRVMQDIALHLINRRRMPLIELQKVLHRHRRINIDFLIDAALHQHLAERTLRIEVVTYDEPEVFCDDDGTIIETGNTVKVEKRFVWRTKALEVWWRASYNRQRQSHSYLRGKPGRKPSPDVASRRKVIAKILKDHPTAGPAEIKRLYEQTTDYDIRYETARNDQRHLAKRGKKRR